MKIECQRSSLSNALAAVSGIISARTPMEIIKGVKMECRSNGIRVVATNLETSIRRDVPNCESDAEGDVMLNASRLQSILKEMPDERVSLDVADNSLTVKGGRSKFKLAIQSADEFPTVKEFGDGGYLQMLASSLRRLIIRTMFAIDEKSTRYAMGGVLMDIESGSITLAATDSRRLAVATAAAEIHGTLGDFNPPIITMAALQLLDRTLADLDDEATVKIAPRGNDIALQTSNATIYSRSIDGRFPAYKQVIPQTKEFSLDMVVGPFHSAVRQSQIITEKESKGVQFTFCDGSLRLSSSVADIGEADIEHPISYDGEELTITFDPQYIAEFLRVLNAEDSVTLDLIDSTSPAVFRMDGYVYVVMPLAKE